MVNLFVSALIITTIIVAVTDAIVFYIVRSRKASFCLLPAAQDILRKNASRQR